MDPSLERSTDSIAAVQPAPTAAALLALIGALLGELRGTAVPPPALDDDLEHALGIDSLARMELLMRLEQAFGLHLPDTAVQQARTPRDLLRSLAAAAAGTAAAAEACAVPQLAERVTAPAPCGLPLRARTLVEVLEWHAAQAGERRHVLLLYCQRAAEELSAAALLQHARELAGALQHQGLERGEAVALMLPTSLEFLQLFMGILLAGGVPVPLYPPLRPEQVEDHLRRQAGILANAQAVLLISNAQARPATRLLRVATPGLRAVLTVEQLRSHPRPWTPVGLADTDTALIQYTSGSTGQPKGVVLTHANLLANIRAMGQALGVGPQDRCVSWLPLYHDMGLIGAWLGSLYHGMPLILLPPQAFVGRPARWLRVISDHRATLSTAPNFAYEILATKVPEAELQGLDLSAWRAALNGAEPVHASTLERFAQRFRASGFDPKALMPVYGLAENGVGLAFPPLGRGPRVDCIDRELLHRLARAQPVDAGHANAMSVVGCGMPLGGHDLRVVDVQGREAADRQEGRIEFRGPSATSGYFRNPEATSALLRGDWRDTGDLGYVADGELFLTGRAKDLIIRGGQHLHPEDLEQSVGSLPGVRRGCVAVIGAADPSSGTERVVVVAETRVDEPGARAALRTQIARLALERLGWPADDIVLVRAHAVPKTSSGKIRRAACRELYERGLLQRPPAAVACQLGRLWLAALGRRRHEAQRRGTDALYGAWAWGLFGLGAALGAAAALLPGRRVRRHVARGLACAGLAAAGLRPRVRGGEHLAGGPWSFVCNHASYLDWLVLMAVLPAAACFVAKRELRRGGLFGWVLQRMGVRFVARDDVGASVADARRLVEAAQAGESLVFFPEGTLSRAPGLLPFHMGAFVAAAQSGQGVLPVSLQGTRSVLRDGSWWPRRGAITVTLHAPLYADGLAWDSLIRLRDAARKRIAAACAEPLRSA
jgi:1-acyl-sn-glycerol-3-phosphate acyltransferase